MKRVALVALVFSLISTTQSFGQVIPEPAPPPPDVRARFNLDPYYEQWIGVRGFPIIASAKVNPYALKEVAWIIENMIGHRPDILQTMVENKGWFSIVPHTEILTEIPEYRDFNLDFLVYNTRGLGGRTMVAPEEDILNYPGNWAGGGTAIHEFAHGMNFGLRIIDPTFDKRLEAAYETAMSAGLWQGTYAATSWTEYWAEGTVAWFYPGDTIRNYDFADTRQELKAYDPQLATLLTEIYGDDQWRYTPVASHAHLPHLQGFNPQDSPTFTRFPELEAIYWQLFTPHGDGNGTWVNLPLHDPAQIQNLTRRGVTWIASTVVLVNLTKNTVLLYTVGADGAERFNAEVGSGSFKTTYLKANELLLVKDTDGNNLAVFQGEEKLGRALIPIDITSTAPRVMLRDISIPDANLRAAIELAIGENGVMGHLTYLGARSAGITKLTGLEHAINLRQLILREDSISDLSPLAGLNNLEELFLDTNNIEDISPLKNLTSVK